MNTMLLTDAYKVDHRRQYPENTTLVYSNWTPRKSRIEGIDEVVFFGLQYFIKKYLMKDFQDNFFSQPKEEICKKYTRRINNYLGPNSVGIKHIEDLHDLGYIPVVIKALPEGVSVPIRVPMFTMYNTLPEFFWITNYLETLVSTTVWLPCNSATIAKKYRKILDKAAEKTSSTPEFVDWQGHDFSMRGMGCLEASVVSGAAHLTSFTGSDTIPAVEFLEEYYNADSDKELIGGSVAATEHSVLCMGTKDGELETFRRLITKVYPTGIVSMVSDTWDLWKVLTEYMPQLKEEILARDGKTVIRPDSGDPVDIICGTRFSDNKGNFTIYNSPFPKERADTEFEEKGVIELLWDTFGGTVNDKGYKELDPRVGAIYGDSISHERAQQICERLEEKGFSSTNVVLGIGSFSYQYNTRDTFGFAMKATYGELQFEKLEERTTENAGEALGMETVTECREIYKDPITDDGTKKSAKGLLRVDKVDGKYTLTDQVSWEEEKKGHLVEVFRDGVLLVDHKLSDIRSRNK